MGNSNHNRAEEIEVVREWLATPLGISLLAQEARVVEEALDDVFGEQCLQIGEWGDSRVFLRHARTQRSSLIVDRQLPEGGSAIGTALGEPRNGPC